jgi:5-methylcytosine-specific restriction endonuclease McrA
MCNKLKCLFCGNVLNKRQFKYCSSSCYGKHQTEQIFKRIESGDTSLYVDNYRKYLIEKYGNKCMKCGWHEINPTTGLVPIQLEHKDGNSDNNNLSNLEILCPNCHSLTPTYGALNKGYGRAKRREKRNKIK